MKLIEPSSANSAGGCLEHSAVIEKGWAAGGASLTFETHITDGKDLTRCAGIHSESQGWFLTRAGEPKAAVECSALSAEDQVLAEE